MSPEMNPIKHLGQQLSVALLEERERLPNAAVLKYVGQRLVTLRRQRGGHTRY